ncbi:MAG TPA: hypothetical protein VEH76_08690 [Methylocystis sp.]|nr:hypothetical protein [Methylocystis sp.]
MNDFYAFRPLEDDDAAKNLTFYSNFSACFLIGQNQAGKVAPPSGEAP